MGQNDQLVKIKRACNYEFMSSEMKIDPSELILTSELATVYSNRFLAIGNSSGVRISFLEAFTDLAISSKSRANIQLSYQDAIELRDLLSTILKPVEAEIKHALKDKSEN